MATSTRERARFAEAPAVHDPHVWGVWDRDQRCWAETPGYAREAASRIAEAMAAACADGSAEAAAAVWYRGLPFSPSPQRGSGFESWGVWDHHRESWAERPFYDLEWAERIATRLNEIYAAGLAAATLAKVR